MAFTDFSYWEYRNPGTPYPSATTGFYRGPTSVIPPGIASTGRSLAIQADNVYTYPGHRFALLWNGPNVSTIRGMVCQRMSTVMRVEDYFSGNYCGFLMLCPSLLSGQTESSTGFTGIFFYFLHNFLLAGSTVPLACALIYNGGFQNTFSTSWNLPFIGDKWVQFEVMSILDNRAGMLPNVYLYARWNTGSAVSTPGSAGWTSWSAAAGVNSYWRQWLSYLYGSNHYCGIAMASSSAGGRGSMRFHQIQIAGGVPAV